MRGLVKAAPAKEEPQPQIDCTGNLQVTCSHPYVYQKKIFTGSDIFYAYDV